MKSSRRQAVRNVFLLLVVFGYPATGIYQVRTEERGVVQRFGVVVADQVAPGLHYHAPWPIEHVTKLKTTEIRTLAIGFNVVDKSLGFEPEAAATELLTGDTNIIGLQATIHYVIEQPARYLFNLEAQSRVIEDTVVSVLFELVAGTDVDTILTTGRTELQQTSREQIQQRLNRMEAGVRITAVNIVALEPPTQVNDAFRDVSSARLDREKLINKAETQVNDILPRARGEAETIVQEAESEKTERITSARSAAQNFAKILQEYSKASEITQQRLYLDTVRNRLSTCRLIFSDRAAGLSIQALLRQPKPSSSRENENPARQN